MAENVELEALDQLVNSAGWKIFTSVIAREWGTSEGGGAVFVDQVSKAVQHTGPEATEHLRQIVAAQREIQRAMRWPLDRIAALKKHEPNTGLRVMSRRGSL